MWWILGVLGGVGVAGWWLFRRNQPIDYPNAETLVRQPPQEQPFLEVDGAFNFRDIGGYLTADGRTVKRGMIYRSARLDRLRPDGLQTLADLGVRLVCDLRSQTEVEEAPDKLPDGADHSTYAIHTEQSTLRRIRAILFERPSLRDAPAKIYREALDDPERAAVFGALIERLSHAENLPAIIHCTAGKDRTGITVALILAVLGVPDETIIADYTLSNHFYPHYYETGVRIAQKMRYLRVRPDDLWPFLVAEDRTLRATLTHIRARYGSVDNYLTAQAGVPAEALARLRAILMD